jgi:hypothetical protein
MKLVALILAVTMALRAEVEVQSLAIKAGLWELRRIRNYDGRQDIRQKCLTDDPTDPFQIIRRGERKVRKSTRTVLAVETHTKVVEGGSRGDLRIEVLDFENVRGTRQLTSAYNQEVRNLSYTFTGN